MHEDISTKQSYSVGVGWGWSMRQMIDYTNKYDRAHVRVNNCFLVPIID
jgi:DNA-binding transcriptional regulator LsrR (DeoR family)